MTHSVLTRLAPIRARCRRRNALSGAMVGLMAATAVAAAALIARGLGIAAVSPFVLLAILVTGPLVGAAVGVFRPLGWPAVAALVDDRAGLKDRACAALEYSASSAPGAFEQLHLRDAEACLAAVEARTVVPLRAPRGWPVLAGAYFAAVTLTLAPLINPPVVAQPESSPAVVVNEAALIEEFARDLATTAATLESEELKQFAKKMKQLAEQMREPGTDVKAALEQMSRLQAELAALRKEFDTKLVDGEMKNLGRAMSGAQPLRETGKALEAGKLQEAAEAAARIREAPADKAEAKAAHDALSRAAEQMAAKGLAKLGKTTEKMADGVKGDPAKLQESGKELARLAHEQERRKRIMEALVREQQKLEECKNRCQQMNRELIEQRKQSERDGTPTQPQQSPGTPQAGADKAEAKGQPKQRPGPKAKQQGIAGNAGDGPVHTETDQVTQDAETSPGRRVTRERYHQFKAMSDALLENEAIPLGHRMAIRRYFELIRPPAEGPPAP